jgi:hypothetical protein
MDQAKTLHTKQRIKYYGWDNRKYCSFMIGFMRSLEPRRYKNDEIILRDLEEVEEIQFVLKGEVLSILNNYLVCNRLHSE